MLLNFAVLKKKKIFMIVSVYVANDFCLIGMIT